MAATAMHRSPFGRRVSQARRSLGISARALSAKAGLSPGLVSLIERGVRGRFVSAGTVEALAVALSVSPSWLLRGDP